MTSPGGDGPSRQDVIDAWPDHETEIRYLQQIGREMYEAGRADMAREAGLIADAQAAAGRQRDGEPDSEVLARVAKAADAARAELDEARWGPGGRGHFGDRRDGDYEGGPVKWDLEQEAGQ
jgi:hypothetical protein